MWPKLKLWLSTTSLTHWGGTTFKGGESRKWPAMLLMEISSTWLTSIIDGSTVAQSLPLHALVKSFGMSLAPSIPSSRGISTNSRCNWIVIITQKTNHLTKTHTVIRPCHKWVTTEWSTQLTTIMSSMSPTTACPEKTQTVPSTWRDRRTEKWWRSH